MPKNQAIEKSAKKKFARIEKQVVVGPFQCNCRLLVCPKTAQAALIDPGDEAPKILKMIEQVEQEFGKPLQIRALLHTHGHLDHIGATRAVKEALLARPSGQQKTSEIFLHRADLPLYEKLQMQGSIFGLRYEPPLAVEQYLEDEQILKVGELKCSVLHTPGHSPGSVSLRLHEDKDLGVGETVYSGDTLFQGSVGRTDLWGANSDLMFKSISERLLTLDEDTRVAPGHGPDTQIGIEKRQNPFLI